MKRKGISILLVLLLFVFGALPVNAEEFDKNKTGSISVTLTEQKENQPMVGAELSVYYVATVGMNGSGNLSYVCTAPFAEAGIDLEDPSLAKTLDAYVTHHAVPAVKMTTDATGTAVCEDLALGLYFIRQTGVVEGFSTCTPFVVTVPGEEADGYVYAVNATPKTEVAKLTSITVKKVWNTEDGKPGADKITIQLLRHGQVVETATLSAENQWQTTYTDMPQSDGYSIKEVSVPKGFVATYSQAGYTFTATNSSTLIQTGQLVWPIPVLAVSGLLLIGAGVAFLRRKRKTNA